MYKIINRKKLVATIAADIIGNTLFFPKLILKQRGAIMPEEIREILVIRTAYIGDVLMTIPILKPLKKRFPNSNISFLTSSKAKEVLENNPYLDEIITYNPFWFYPARKSEYFNFIKNFKKKHFDLVIETRADIRELLFLVWPLKAKFKLSYDIGGGGCFLTHCVPYKGLKHKVEYHLDLARYLGAEIKEIEWGIYLTDEENKRVEKIMHSTGITQPFISLHPGSRLSLKKWSNDRYAGLCDKVIEEYGIQIIILGEESERESVDNMLQKMKQKPVSLVGKTNLRDLAGLLSRSILFICNDSAPMHIAAAMKTPTVAIFGPSKSIETRPYGKIHRVVEKDFPCRYTCDESICTNDSFNACMSDIKIEDVFSAVRDFLKELKI